MKSHGKQKSTRCIVFDRQHEEGVWASLAEIEAAIQSIKNPTGTKDMPARTCRDLALAHPHFENGRLILLCRTPSTRRRFIMVLNVLLTICNSEMNANN